MKQLNMCYVHRACVTECLKQHAAQRAALDIGRASKADDVDDRRARAPRAAASARAGRRSAAPARPPAYNEMDSAPLEIRRDDFIAIGILSNCFDVCAHAHAALMTRGAFSISNMIL
ncbi:hypothetical protein EVAR_11436_1 [Eumeta japonica]|uniref:Uncharacterized protein n=1 Tax=Eumeta variegata TaxID=151549 RepID=A0A4C1TND6_EUMVA|nr:hypothetical protein EVAR_11436_1 [Eumeta japonica]